VRASTCASVPRTTAVKTVKWTLSCVLLAATRLRAPRSAHCVRQDRLIQTTTQPLHARHAVLAKARMRVPLSALLARLVHTARTVWTTARRVRQDRLIQTTTRPLHALPAVLAKARMRVPLSALLVRLVHTVKQLPMTAARVLSVSRIRTSTLPLRVSRVRPARSLLKALSPAVHAASERTALSA
jgi:hypothetical protein